MKNQNFLYKAYKTNDAITALMFTSLLFTQLRCKVPFEDTSERNQKTNTEHL